MTRQITIELNDETLKNCVGLSVGAIVKNGESFSVVPVEIVNIEDQYSVNIEGMRVITRAKDIDA